jgi:hypothetical protein
LTDANPYVLDLKTRPEGVCSEANTVGVALQVGNECMEHSHPDLYNAVDFSTWTLAHPGNKNAASASAGRANKTDPALG